jgi:hypothetical protein
VKKKLGLLALIACVTLAACGGNSVAAYIGVIGQAVDSIIQLEDPGWAGAAEINTLLAKAQADAQNWKAGTPSQDFVAVLNDLGAAIDSIPLNPKIDSLVGIAVAAVDSIVAIVSAENNAPTTYEQRKIVMAFVESMEPSAPAKARQHHWNGKQPKSAKDFKKLWNAQAPAAAKLK